MVDELGEVSDVAKRKNHPVARNPIVRTEASQMAKRAVVQAGAAAGAGAPDLLVRRAVTGAAKPLVRSAVVIAVAMVEDNMVAGAGSVPFPNRSCLVVRPRECETGVARDVTEMTTCTVERTFVLATTSDNTSMVIQHIT